MKFQAPVGVTAIFCGGELVSLDENRCFDAAEILAVELAPHGCVALTEIAPEEKGAPSLPRSRARSEKAN